MLAYTRQRNGWQEPKNGSNLKLGPLRVIELYTIEECAAKARVSPKTLRRDIADCKLITTMVRGCPRIAPNDWEEYLRKCRSDATVKDGKSAFNMPVVGLAELLQRDRTPRPLKRNSGSKSTIIALDERRATRSRTR
jgi:hypothetical protein